LKQQDINSLSTKDRIKLMKDIKAQKEFDMMTAAAAQNIENNATAKQR
jgi:hypothetical protein